MQSETARKTACARACSLSKQSGERKANNQSAQGKTKWRKKGQQSVSPRHRLGYRTQATFGLKGQKNRRKNYFTPSGRILATSLSRRALPWAGISQPLRGAPLSPSLGVIDEVASLVEEWGWGWVLGASFHSLNGTFAPRKNSEGTHVRQKKENSFLCFALT